MGSDQEAEEVGPCYYPRLGLGRSSAVAGLADVGPTRADAAVNAGRGGRDAASDEVAGRGGGSTRNGG